MKCCSYSPNGRSEINKTPLTSQLNANALCFTPCQQVVYSTGGKHTTVEKRYIAIKCMLHQSSFTVETCIFANIFWNIIYLWGRAHLKRLKNHINHSLGCEHVSSNHSCILGRLEDGPRRDDDIDGCEATLNMGKERWSKKQPRWITIAPRPKNYNQHSNHELFKVSQELLDLDFYLIEGDVLSNHAAQAVDKCRQGDGPWSVAVPPHLCSCPCEVKHRTAL